MTSPPRLFTEDEAAEYLGITRATLARIRRAAKIGHVVIGGRRYRYLEKHLAEFVHMNSRQPSQRQAKQSHSSADQTEDGPRRKGGRAPGRQSETYGRGIFKRPRIR